MLKSPLSADIKERISIIRYPMIYLIVVVHLPALVSATQDSGLLTLIGTFVDNGLIRFAVPMLTCVSGYLLFHKSLDLQYTMLLRKRFVSLVTPLMVWNIPLVLALYVVQSQGLIEHDWAAGRRVYPFNPMIWLNGVFSVTSYPISYPMHFLRDLFVLVLLAPGIGILIRRFPFVGLIALLAIFAPGLDGWFLLNDTMIIMFYIGGMAAIRNWNIRSLDQFAVPLIFLLLLICVSVAYFDLGRPFWVPLLTPILVWPASSLLAGTTLGRWLASLSRSSVFLFMLHGLVVSALAYALPNLYAGEYAFLLWLTTPILIASGCHCIFSFLDRFFPSFLILLMGGRKVKVPGAIREKAAGAIAVHK